ncbi:unnamed protein product [Blepharisma stoltei]|uniref:Uncharacterized protein n=1 Tax=Blepharisma stoltei TaxID=1481888 RepID=A0AAU9JZX7_9CILI|nr:unnamed protein product [Blepharisma stoltei]
MSSSFPSLIDQEASRLVKKYNLDPSNDIKNIDETIKKSQQIIQQSKNLTLKNQQRKMFLEEKFKNLLGGAGEMAHETSSPILYRYSTNEETEDKESSNQYAIQRAWEYSQEPEIPTKFSTMPAKQAFSSEWTSKELEEENRLLKLELSSKNSEILSLKEVINSLQKDNARLFEEAQTISHRSEILSKKYEELYKKQAEINSKRNNSRSSSRKRQKSEESSLEYKTERKRTDEKNYSEKISELEQRLLKSSQRYEDLKDRLEKAESLILRSNLTPMISRSSEDISTSNILKNRIPSPELKKGKKKKLKSETVKLSKPHISIQIKKHKK